MNLGGHSFEEDERAYSRTDQRTALSRKFALVLTAVALVAAGCGGNDADGGSSSSGEAIPQSETLQLRFGAILKSPVYWTFFAAEELGYLEEENLDVDVVTVRGDSECIQAIVGGSLDACPSNVDSLVRAAQGGAGIRAIATMTDPSVHSLVGAPDVRSFEDLRGKDIAAQGQEEGSTVAIFALLAANGFENPRNEVNMVDVGGNSDRYAALTSGKVSAAVLTQPGDFIAVDEGNNLLGISPEAKPISNYVVAIPEGPESHHETLRRLVQAMSRSAGWIMDPDNEDAAVDQLETAFEMDRKYARAFYDLYVGELRYLEGGVNPSAASIDESLDVVDTYTSTDVTLTAADLIETRYVEAIDGE